MQDVLNILEHFLDHSGPEYRPERNRGNNMAPSGAELAKNGKINASREPLWEQWEGTVRSLGGSILAYINAPSALLASILTRRTPRTVFWPLPMLKKRFRNFL